MLLYILEQMLKNISGLICVNEKDYLLHLTDINGVGIAHTLSLATYIALCSASLNKPVASSLAVLGDLTIGGTIQKVDDLGSVLQACLDSGAKKILLPASATMDMSTVPFELFSKFNILFYSNPEDAVLKALAIE